MKPKYTILAGVNGAGKSTLAYSRTLTHGYPLVNTDNIVKQIDDWKDSEV